MYVFLRSELGWTTRQELGAIPTTSDSLLFCEDESEMERERVRKRGEKEYRCRAAVWWENTPHETDRPIL